MPSPSPTRCWTALWARWRLPWSTEQYVTALINDIYAAALEAKDFRCQTFLQWFITEQLEEEDNAEDMITKMKLFGSDPKGLYALDAEYAARVYTVPSPLAGK